MYVFYEHFLITLVGVVSFTGRPYRKTVLLFVVGSGRSRERLTRGVARMRLSIVAYTSSQMFSRRKNTFEELFLLPQSQVAPIECSSLVFNRAFAIRYKLNLK